VDGLCFLLSNPIPLSFTSSSRTASTDFCLHRSFLYLPFFIFIFSLFFVSGPCARLSWPSRQLLSARKSTVSYRIVSYRMLISMNFCFLIALSRTHLSHHVDEYKYSSVTNTLLELGLTSFNTVICNAKITFDSCVSNVADDIIEAL